MDPYRQCQHGPRAPTALEPAAPIDWTDVLENGVGRRR